MVKNKQWQIKNHQDEYLEVILSKETELKEKRRVFFLHDQRYLTCYVHLSDTHCLLLDIEGLVSLKKYLQTHTINQSILKEWIEELIEVFYENRQDTFLEELAYIFIDEENGQLRFACLPVIRTNALAEMTLIACLMELFENIDFDGDEEWLSHLYMLIRQRPFRVVSLKKFLNEKTKKHRFSLFFKKKYDEEDFFKAFEVHEQMATYNEAPEATTLIQNDFKTQVLMAGFQCGYLEDEKGGQVFISQTPWLIGRQEGCQQRLAFPEISKIHAKIMIENGRSYLVDLGSTNGTECQYHRLVKDEKITLNDGDVINLAGHLFTYHE